MTSLIKKHMKLCLIGKRFYHLDKQSDEKLSINFFHTFVIPLIMLMLIGLIDCFKRCIAFF